MKIKTLTLAESRRRFEEWKAGGLKPFKLSEDYEDIREMLYALQEEAEDEAKKICGNTSDRLSYTTDVLLGLKLYAWLATESWFSVRIASDPGFWRYLTVVAVPNLVNERWGTKPTQRYYEKSTRIYLSSLWWYVHLSWRGTVAATQDLLLSPIMTSDTLLNLVERVGPFGIYVDTMRTVMFYYSRLKREIMIGTRKASAREIFRAVMKLHMAKAFTVNPHFFSGGQDGYVKTLFKEAGIDESDFTRSRG